MSDNEHIQNPLNNPFEYYFKERMSPLNKEDVIYGDFLLYYSCGHSGVELVKSFKNVDEIEKRLLSINMCHNVFSIHEIVILYGKIKKYKIINNQVIWFD